MQCSQQGISETLPRAKWFVEPLINDVHYTSTGFKEFIISHRSQTGKGTYKYSILEASEGAPRAPVHLSGAADRDPLKGIQHVMLKIKDGDHSIVGIQIGSECVVRKD